MKDIQIDPHVDSIGIPENLRIGLMVAKHRGMCAMQDCPFDYAALAFGQSPFHLPPSLRKALSKHADKGHYSSAAGIKDLRKAISGFYKRHFDLDVESSRIVIGPGTKDLIFTIFTMVHGVVIVPSPAWVGYTPQLRMLNKHFHAYYLKPEHDFRIQPDHLSRYLADLAYEQKQHLLVLNNPHNPTGVLYSEEELRAIADVCRKYNTLILADEIYALTTYKIEDFVSMGKIYPEGTFVTNGLSKDRSAGGYRLGSCILPEQTTGKLKKEFIKIAATVYTNVSTPIQYAAVSAYEPNEEIDGYLMNTREIHRLMGTYMSNEFNKIVDIKATKPQGGFYFFVDFNTLKDDLKRKGIMTSNELGDSLMGHPYHIATVTGDSAFLQPDNFGARIAFVDYDGMQAYHNYLSDPPKTDIEEEKFVKSNAPRMFDAVERVKEWIKSIRE